MGITLILYLTFIFLSIRYWQTLGTVVVLIYTLYSFFLSIHYWQTLRTGVQMACQKHWKSKCNLTVPTLPNIEAKQIGTYVMLVLLFSPLSPFCVFKDCFPQRAEVRCYSKNFNESKSFRTQQSMLWCWFTYKFNSYKLCIEFKANNLKK